jgi:hypothetical protein
VTISRVGDLWSKLLPYGRQRAYPKDVTDKTWDLAVSLQHDTNATPRDAEWTLETVRHLLSRSMFARRKHKPRPPARARAAARITSLECEIDVADDEEGLRLLDHVRGMRLVVRS